MHSAPQARGPAQAAVEPRPLRAGARFERAFGSEDAHVYRVQLEAGQYLQVVVEQLGLDVALRLSGPDGRVRIAIDAWQGQTGSEELALVADAGASFTLELRPTGARDAGHYRLRVAGPRAASAVDRRRAEAVRISAAAAALRATDLPDRLREAHELYARETDAWRALGDRRQLGRALRCLAATRAALADAPAALAPLEESLRLARATGDRPAQALALSELASVYWRLSRVPDARRAARRALHAARAARDRAAEAVALGLLGSHARSVGDYDEALVRHQAARDIWRALGERRRQAVAEQDTGEVYTLLGRLDEAQEFFTRAAGTHRAGGDVRRLADSLAWLGWTERLAGRQDEAARHCEEAARAYAEVGDQSGMVWVAQNRGDALYALGRWDDALAAYRQGLALAGPDLRIAGNMLGRIARAQASAGQVDPARHAFAQATELLRRAQDRDSLVYLLLYEARMWRDHGRLETAEGLAREALDTLEDLRRAAGGDVSRRTYLATRAEFYEFLIDLLMRRDESDPGRGFAERAFEVAERGRARALLDDLARPHADEAPVDEPAGRVLNTVEDERLRLAATGAAPAAQAEALARVGAALRAREIATMASSPHGTFQPPQPLDLEAIRRDVLDDQTLLLMYAVGEDHSYLWLVGRDVFRAVRLPARRVLTELAMPVYEGLQIRSHVRRAAVLGHAARLSDAVLGPVLPLPAGKRLRIIADGVLLYIPFAALPVRPTGALPRELVALDWPEGRVPLLAEHEVTSAPSASVLALLRLRQRRRHPPPGLLAVIADPLVDRDDERLSGRKLARAAPDSRRDVSDTALERSARDVGLKRLERLKWTGVEARALLELARPAPTFAAIGLESNREVVLGGRLRDFQIVHFATHGFLNARHPDLSGLLLSRVDAHGAAREGFLRVHELERLHLRADLVVLSACQTALGQDVRGEGLVGLTQGFLRAGAASLVVSLWNVGDQPTSRLMERFYRGLLRRGLRPAAALRAAQIEMLRDPALSAPIDWAGFVFLGDR